MSVESFYNRIDGDYSGTLIRLAKEDRVLKYLKRFIESEDYKEFLNHLEAKDYSEAFRFVHNIKGMSLNLGLSKLSEISSEICDDLRGGDLKYDISEKLNKLEEIYKEIMEAAGELDVAGDVECKR